MNLLDNCAAIDKKTCLVQTFGHNSCWAGKSEQHFPVYFIPESVANCLIMNWS